MARYGAPARPMTIGIISIILGVLGLAVCWWTPTGMVLSLAGIVIGFIGCLTTRRGGWAPSAVGLILSAAALTVCWIIAAWGVEWVRFGGLR